MLGLSLRNDAQQRLKIGQPAQSTTGVASASCSQCASGAGHAAASPRPNRWSAMTQSKSGSASAALIQKRRRMSRYSALGPSIDRDRLGLERHAADRAVARPHLLDLGVHRAGVDGVRRHCLRRGPRAFRILLGCGVELARAAWPEQNQ